MSKIIVMPGVIDTELLCVTLKHPKDYSNCQFYLEPTGTKAYELNVKKNKFYSWFLNESVVQDGNLYILTPIDPLFLLIPLIFNNQDKYSSLSDIFLENNVASTQVSTLENLYTIDTLKCIANVKNFEDEIFIQFSEERTLKWLELKFDKIKKSVKNNSIGKSQTGFQINDYVSGDVSEDDCRMVAFELLTDYVCKELRGKLKQSLRIPDKDELFTTTSNGHKRKLSAEVTSPAVAISSSDSTDDKKIPREVKVCHQAPRLHPLTFDLQKPKLTRTQRILNKVDKSKMKSISSYFKQK